MKTYTIKELAKNLLNISKSFAEVQNEENCKENEIIEMLKFYEWYCRYHDKNEFYVRISTYNGFILMNDRNIFEHGLICNVYLMENDFMISYTTK